MHHVVVMRDVIRRNAEGVLLNYGDAGALRPFHLEQRPRRLDGERAALLHAERALLRLELILNHLDGTVSCVGIEEMLDAVWLIRRSLDLTRAELDMRRVEFPT